MNTMNTNKATMPVKKDQKSTFKKDLICLVLVVIAVFILHAFSRSAIEQLYKTKEKTNTGTGAVTKNAEVF